MSEPNCLTEDQVVRMHAEQLAVFGGHRLVVQSMCEKYGGRLFGHLLLIGE